MVTYKKAVLFAGLLYFACLCFSLYKESFFNGFLNVNVFTGTIIILILVVVYYIDLLKSRLAINFLSLPEFWVVTGLLVFNIGYLPILILIHANIETAIDTNMEMFILNLLLYGSFIKAFLCYKPQN
ncbi:hypothetical protein [Aestuariibaculum sediminum]|uniref:Uncharacterized protein n=1 Tax=Aestuariibaculum sediminum TaxID=2770637 RepID=A0A8J6Q8B0_9FLAO|nr:hypothetical protein [Aestuariibaculum sediminum]MBD0831402.1 hypothetical protein [Aestuariibaculum sediminum]